MNLKIVAVISAIQLLSLCLAEEPSWSWNQKEQPSPIAQKRSDDVNSTANESDSQGRHLYSEQEIYSNDTSVDDVVDSILSFGREGRNLDEYGPVYTDPSVQDALQRGDDSQARNLIKEKLCSLGLMQCDVADAEGKRFYRPPGSAIYAQGPPPPRPPFRPPHGSFGPPPGFGPPQGPYGPPKPMPYPPSGGKFGPPRKVGYEGPILSKPPYPSHTLGPVYSGQFVDSPPPSIHGGGDSGITFSKPPPGSIIYGSSKPPGAIFESVDAPYNFEHIVGEKIHVENSYAHHQQSTGLGGIGEPKPTIVVNAQGGGAGAGLSQAQAANSASLQQHVHHHFHHVDGETAKAPIVPVAVPLPSGNSITSDFASIATSSAAFAPINHVNSVNNGFELNKQASQSAAFNAGFNSATQSGFLAGNTLSSGFGGVNGGAVRPVNGLYGSGIKPVSEPGLGSYGSGFTGGFGSNSGSFGSNTGSFGSNSGSFGSNGGSFGSNSGTFGANSGSFGSSGFDQTAAGIYNAAGGFQSSNGAAAGGFHSSNPEYYKKELNINGGAQGNSLTGYAQQNKYGSQYGAQFNQYSGSEDYSGLETSRQQSIDCVCVPFNQCPAADRLGRKDDLILPLDPRNLGTEIEALPEDQNNSTTTPSPANTEEIKKISKREAAQDKQSDESEQPAANAEARLTVSSNYNNNNNYPDDDNYDNYPNNNNYLPQHTIIALQRKKVLPTFGVSFGLPLPSGAFGGHTNPNFGALGLDGLNFGLVNVNPLVSLQVTKSEKGERLVKPLVNLHITPNERVIHKVSSLFQAAKLPHQQHYHHHSHHAYPPPPEIIHGPPLFNYAPPPPFAHHHPTGEGYYPSGGGYGFAHPPQSIGPFVPEHTAPDFAHYPTGPSFPFGFTSRGVYDRSSNVTDETGYAGSYEYSRDNRQGKGIQFDEPLSGFIQTIPTQVPGAANGGKNIAFPNDRRRRSLEEREVVEKDDGNNNENRREKRQLYGGRPQQCSPSQVCCRRPFRPQQQQQLGRCGTRNAHGITGRIKNPVYIDGDSEFGEYPWQVAILKKDPKESVYVCGGTVIDQLHVITAAHCVKTYGGFDLRARLGEWDVNHDVEFFPYIERDVVSVHVHPEYYAGTLDNDLAILKLDHPIDFTKSPHISPACLPDKYSDYTGARCWTTGWGKDAFGDYGKYQNILKEVDVPVINQQQCQNQLRHTRLGHQFKLHPGFVCAGGEEGKDACKGDGGGPMVCERNGVWQLVGVVSWGIGCGQVNVPGVYVRVSYYLDWINQITRSY